MDLKRTRLDDGVIGKKSTFKDVLPDGTIVERSGNLNENGQLDGKVTITVKPSKGQETIGECNYRDGVLQDSIITNIGSSNTTFTEYTNGTKEVIKIEDGNKKITAVLLDGTIVERSGNLNENGQLDGKVTITVKPSKGQETIGECNYRDGVLQDNIEIKLSANENFTMYISNDGKVEEHCKYVDGVKQDDATITTYDSDGTVIEEHCKYVDGVKQDDATITTYDSDGTVIEEHCKYVDGVKQDDATITTYDSDGTVIEEHCKYVDGVKQDDATITTYDSDGTVIEEHCKYVNGVKKL